MKAKSEVFENLANELEQNMAQLEQQGHSGLHWDRWEAMLVELRSSLNEKLDSVHEQLKSGNKSSVAEFSDYNAIFNSLQSLRARIVSVSDEPMDNSLYE